MGKAAINFYPFGNDGWFFSRLYLFRLLGWGWRLVAFYVSRRVCICICIYVTFRFLRVTNIPYIRFTFIVDLGNRLRSLALAKLAHAVYGFGWCLALGEVGHKPTFIIFSQDSEGFQPGQVIF